MKSLEHAILYFGSQRKLASKLGVSAMAVSKWRRSRVPAERCRVIERLTQGAVTVHDLRPDVFGPPPLAGEGS
jgi:DNA-binding transcriptional regulator YdaS (Cro superfamily)